MAHCTATSTFSASWVGPWAGGPSSRSYTPVRTSIEDQPAAFAPAMSGMARGKTFDRFQSWRQRKNLPDSGLSMHGGYTQIHNKKERMRGLTSNHIAGHAEH